jgi:O-glycosyl hydrolase
MRLTLLAFSFFLIFGAVNAYSQETMLLDFESSTVPATVGAWLNYSNAGPSVSTWSAPNPLINTINPSQNAYKIVKQTGDPYWTGLEINLMNAIKITTTNQYLHVLVYKTTGSRIAVTYRPEGGAQSSDNWQSNDATGTWIDYVINIPVGTNLKMFAIKIADDPGTYYFDQVRLSNNPNSLTKSMVTIDPAIKHQVMEGWGGSLCWWANIMGGYSDSKIKTICDWITDPNTGLNMNIFRFNIGGGDDPTHNHMRGDGGNMPGYRASATAPYDWTQDANQRKILQQLIASRIARFGSNDIKLVAFSNSPPYWMTRSGCSAGSVEGNVTNLKSDMFDDFAEYLTEVVRYYHDSLGITFNYLEPFNEPDGGWWKAFGNQEGCFFSNNDQIVMIRELYAKLSEKNMLSYCRITANDANSIDAGLSAMQAYKNAGDIVPKIDLVSVHSYHGSRRSELYNWTVTNSKKLWQSESGPLGVGGTNEFQIMTVSDRIITDLREMKCSAWIDWQLAADGSPTWGLIVGEYSNLQNPVTRAISYYVRAQFSRYIKPGYRIISSSAFNSIAALSPDEKELVIVVSNKEQMTQNFNFDLSRFEGFGRVKQIRTRAQESLGVRTSETFFNITGKEFSYTSQPETVTTFVIPLQTSTAVRNPVYDGSQEITYNHPYIELTNSKNNGMIELFIYNTAGVMQMASGLIPANGKYTAFLETGVYLVQCIENEQIFVRKLIVK